jgi:hypothetical protein
VTSCCVVPWQDPGSITETQLLRWQGTWDSSGSSSRPHSLNTRQGLGSPAGSPTAAAAAGGGSAAFTRAMSGYRGAVPQAAGDAAIAALEAVTGPTAATAAAAAAAGSSAARRTDIGFGGVLGLPGGRGQHLAELAPLSGLQPPAPRSRIVSDTMCTAGEELYLR